MVVTSGVISPVIWVRTRVTLLITPLITTHEPPSSTCTTLQPHNSRGAPCDAKARSAHRTSIATLPADDAVLNLRRRHVHFLQRKRQL